MNPSQLEVASREPVGSQSAHQRSRCSLCLQRQAHNREAGRSLCPSPHQGHQIASVGRVGQVEHSPWQSSQSTVMAPDALSIRKTRHRPSAGAGETPQATVDPSGDMATPLIFPTLPHPRRAQDAHEFGVAGEIPHRTSCLHSPSRENGWTNPWRSAECPRCACRPRRAGWVLWSEQGRPAAANTAATMTNSRMERSLLCLFMAAPLLTGSPRGLPPRSSYV